MTKKTMDRGTLYLSGGMQFAENLGGDWREKSAQALKQMNYFPLDITELDKAYLNAFGKPTMENYTETDILNYKAHMRKHFVETDLNLIQHYSDALIVYYDESAQRGAGTVSETQFAYNMNIPIFLVADCQTEKEMCDSVSGWLIALTTKTFVSFDDLHNYLDSLPYGILKKDRFGNHCANNQYLCNISGEVFTKNGNKFVSQMKPLYSKKAVDIVYNVYENTADRLDFFIDYLKKQD